MPKRLTEIAILVGWSVAILGLAWKISADRSETLSRLEAQVKQAGDHEERLRALEHSVSAIQADVRWIRQALERRP